MAANMSDAEYSLQYFEFTPEEFFKDFSNTLLREMALIVRQSIKIWSDPNCELNDKEALIKHAVALHETWSERAEIVLNGLKPTIIDFFTIPKNVLLPSDHMQATQYSKQDVAKLKAEVKELEAKYVEETTRLRTMTAELAILDKLELIQRKADEAVQSVQQFGSTVKVIKEIEKLAAAYNECKEAVLLKCGDDDNDDKDSDDNDDNYIIHSQKFKTAF